MRPQLRLVERRVPRNDEHGLRLRANSAERLEEPLEVLVRPLRGDRKHDRRFAELEALADLVP